MSDAGFYVYARKRKRSRPVYYARFRLPDGTWSAGKNTGQTSADRAQLWAQEQLDTGKVKTAAGPDPTLRAWADGFFGAGGRYAEAKRARGRTLSDTYVYSLGNAYKKRIEPVFGHRKLRDITPLELEEHFLDLYQNSGLAGSTVNWVLKAARALFNEAERLAVIPRNPAAKVARFAENGRERGVLSQAELDKLFASDALKTVWGGKWQPYLIAMLAAGAGARHGEAVALRPEDVGENTILISRAWNPQTGAFTPPKWNSVRAVPSPPRLRGELETYIKAMGLSGEALLFEDTGTGRPIGHELVLGALRDALEAAGIPRAKQGREERFLDLHALRHTYITRLRSEAVADWEIQAAAGHRSVTMTDRYTHATAADLRGVAGANILPFKKGA